MLPLDKPWYTKLLFLSLLLGASGGVAALLYTGITDGGIAAIFGDAQSGWFTGDWWWILVTAAGGLAVAGLRKAWTIPENVPGAIALAGQAWVEPAAAPYWVIISIVSLIISAVLIAKMFAIALSQASGFLGGVVFPIIFIGGTAGLLINTLFPGIPIALAVGTMLAAVPGAFLKAPLSLILIAVATIGIAPEALMPVAIAVITAHITLSLIQTYLVRERQVKLQAQ